MKKVLSQLHNAIIELEDNNLIKEATVLSEVFTKLADYKDPYQTKTRHEMTRLKRKGNKPWEGNDLSTYDIFYDIKIRRAPPNINTPVTVNTTLECNDNFLTPL